MDAVSKNRVNTSVPNPWHFETDPDPWIRTLEYGSGSGSGSCSFVSGFQETMQKVCFFKVLVETKVFLKIFLVEGSRSGSGQKNYGSWWTKTYRSGSGSGTLVKTWVKYCVWAPTIAGITSGCRGIYTVGGHTREYRMIYRGLGFLAVTWFCSSPAPFPPLPSASCLSFFSVPRCRRSS
jgi:hypothetical protein